MGFTILVMNVITLKPWLCKESHSFGTEETHFYNLYNSS